MQQLETQRGLRRIDWVKKQDRKTDAVDRLSLWFSTGRDIDGLWVGTTEDKPYPGLRRVEDALQLIKRHDSLHYSRAIHNLARVWVRLLPTARACYDRSLKACVLDERYVLLETTTLEQIACTIIHEATHAKLERWGISYDEKERSRIEAVCLRRELHFIGRLPRGEQLSDEKALTLEWCLSDHDYFSDLSFQQRHLQGVIETLRYLGAPDWLIRILLKVRAVVSGVHRLVSVARRPQRKA